MSERLPFADHLEALRKTLLLCLATLLVGFTVAFLCCDSLFALLTRSLDTQLVLLGPLEGLLTTFRVAFWTGLVGTAPIWGFLLLRFCAPALQGHELRLIAPFLLLSLLLIGAGLSLGLYGSLPLATRILWHFNEGLGQNFWTVSSYLGFCVPFLLAHGALFELVALLLFLVHLGVLTPQTLASHRRSAYIAILILAAIATPPDVITQCLLALPLILLYEGAILYGRSRYGFGTRIRS